MIKLIVHGHLEKCWTLIFGEIVCTCPLRQVSMVLLRSSILLLIFGSNFLITNDGRVLQYVNIIVNLSFPLFSFVCFRFMYFEAHLLIACTFKIIMSS